MSATSASSSSRVALVIGGASGIGYAVADALLRADFNVVVGGRNTAKLSAAVEQLRSKHPRECLAVPVDVREPKSVAAALDSSLSQLGHLEVLVNSAGVNFPMPADKLSYSGLKAVLDVSVLGVFNVCKAAFKKWFRAHGGTIVNISGTMHYGATRNQLHAAAGKAAQDALTRSLALEWGRYNIRVNAVAPGPTLETEGLRVLVPDEERRARVIRRTPLGTMAHREDVAAAVAFLSSDAARHVTGATIVVDGGAWLAGAGRVAFDEPFQAASGQTE